MNNLRHSLQPQVWWMPRCRWRPRSAAERTRTVGVWQGSAAEQAKEMAPRGVTIVSAFTVSAAAPHPDNEIDEDVLIAATTEDPPGGGPRAENSRPPVDCGDLEIARILEQLTPLLISLNKRHKIKHSGIKLTGYPRIVRSPAVPGGAKLAADCSMSSDPTGLR